MGGTPNHPRRAEAVRLRTAGYSRSQIARAMGLRSTGVLSRWLRGVPAPEWTRRPRAKDDLRERAVRLRREGRSYGEILAAVPVSRSTLSLWLRDVPLSEEHRAALEARAGSARQRAAATLRAATRARRERMVEEAAAQIGSITPAELFVAGVVAYWAEGTKPKPWNQRAMVEFTNSDSGMIVLFLRWLDLIGVPDEDRAFRVTIHERADVQGAVAFWSKVVGVPPDRFLRTTLKRHNPSPRRRNLGAGYRGCLRVVVRRSGDLLERIQGWFDGIVSTANSSAGDT